ncbi:MAG: hemolysin family protein [Planctomycetota bacterium]
MSQVIENIGRIVLLLVLLAFSAFFSGSETAFFNLTPRQVSSLRKSGHRFQRLAARLLRNPSKLLSSLLFGNMAVNISYFAVSSVLLVRVKEQAGGEWAVVTGVLTFSILLLFGEIFPKSLSYANSKTLSTLSAFPAYLFLKLFGPIVSVLRFMILDPVLRLILGPINKPEQISSAEFKSLIDKVSDRGLISADENKLIREVVELGYLKVRHVMRPRVDMPMCDVTESNERFCEVMRNSNQTKIPVYAGNMDNIVGIVMLRQLLLNPEVSADRLVQRVHFVPEQKKVESLLEFFRRSHSDMAVVVDEYGQVAGSVCLEDIAEELLGPIESTDDIATIEHVGPCEYRLSGDLAIHELADSFSVELFETRISTVGGLVTALLGRIPKSGDIVHHKNLKFTVERVLKRRIETLILNTEAVKSKDA